MCILLREDDGKLSLDDDIRTYLSEMPIYESPITIRHLLHHTSGIRDIETLVPMAEWPCTHCYFAAQQLRLLVVGIHCRASQWPDSARARGHEGVDDVVALSQPTTPGLPSQKAMYLHYGSPVANRHGLAKSTLDSLG